MFLHFPTNRDKLKIRDERRNVEVPSFWAPKIEVGNSGEQRMLGNVPHYHRSRTTMLNYIQDTIHVGFL